MITLTERAAAEIRSIMEAQGKSDAMLRVFVSGGGCSGLQYGMAIDDIVDEGDQVFDSHGVKIVIDPLSLGYMSGSEVDFVEDSLGGGFKIDNPNAIRSCGCGQSFATDEGQ
ncbi:MAG: iron-sulfur cluster insertion protein ErpA, partial [Armatimonadota bacterium]|nr:iron-sulfur cluster insertion protein ErpA [Armatimonadota bacterium]